MMKELFAKNINVPQHVEQLNGNFYNTKNIHGKTHLIRLLTYVPGDLLTNFEYTDELSYNCGRFIAKTHEVLSNVRHSSLVNFERTWSLGFIRNLGYFLDSVPDLEEKETLKKIKDSFEKEVYSIQDQLPHAAIHADFNDRNVLIKNYDVVGLIDFGDAQIAPKVYDLALCMFYLIVDCKRENYIDWLTVGRNILKGYESIRRLEDLEKKALSYCLLGRFFQSYGCYWYLKENHKLDSYTSSMTKRHAFHIFKKFNQVGHDELTKEFFNF